jgi:hypothetical protein
MKVQNLQIFCSFVVKVIKVLIMLTVVSVMTCWRRNYAKKLHSHTQKRNNFSVSSREAHYCVTTQLNAYSILQARQEISTDTDGVTVGNACNVISGRNYSSGGIVIASSINCVVMT